MHDNHAKQVRVTVHPNIETPLPREVNDEPCPHVEAVAMGCQQSTVASYETTSTVSETTCRSTYGPRLLTSIPTTTRTTTSNILSVERPLQWSTFCDYVTVPYTVTQRRFIIVTETAPRTVGIPTSTGTAYVSSTVYETVSETITETTTAPTVSITPESYTIPAPIGFTPIASNPINAGADTFTPKAVASSTIITQDNPPAPSATDDTIDPATVVPPGRLLLATGLHARAEKSFSNVNRVICDETTRFYTTSVKPFTVRNTKLTSTITLTDYYYPTTTFEDTVSTATETPVDHEETTEIQAFTESTTTLFYETTTVTPTIELSELPRSTAYAACGADNFIGGIAGHGIVGVSLEPRDRSGVTTHQFTADSPRSCCEACVSQTDTPCVGSVWFLDMCFFIVNTEQCDGSEAMISFDLSRDREVLANEGMILSNGACGQQVWSRRYCDEFSGNCDGADPTPSELSPAPTEIT